MTLKNIVGQSKTIRGRHTPPDNLSMSRQFLNLFFPIIWRYVSIPMALYTSLPTYIHTYLLSSENFSLQNQLHGVPRYYEKEKNQHFLNGDNKRPRIGQFAVWQQMALAQRPFQFQTKNTFWAIRGLFLSSFFYHSLGLSWF